MKLWMHIGTLWYSGLFPISCYLYRLLTGFTHHARNSTIIFLYYVIIYSMSKDKCLSYIRMQANIGNYSYIDRLAISIEIDMIAKQIESDRSEVEVFRTIRVMCSQYNNQAKKIIYREMTMRTFGPILFSFILRIIMKLNITHPNYAAEVVEVKNLLPLEGCDFVVWMPIFWLQAIVSKDVKVGDIGILFPAECQLSDAYCKMNNLYRHAEMNANTEEKGYIEDNRRVRAVKFRWQRSSALFMPLESLSYLWKVSLSLWDKFNEIDGHEICTKYMIYTKDSKGNRISWKNKVFERIDNKTFPEHLDSDNYFRNSSKIAENEIVIVTQKLHWTSARFGYCKWRRKLKRYEKLLKLIGVKINEIEYDHFYGSRRVIKNWTIIKNQVGYYENDLWKEALERYKHLIPKDYIIYGEIIGRDGSKPIQKNYTYKIPQWTLEFYVYRISIVNDDGFITDLSRAAIKDFCYATWMKFVPEMCIAPHWMIDVAESYMNRRFYDVDPYLWCVPLDKESPCDEWVIVRREWIIPYLTKAKSPDFLEMETKLLDEWVEDIETQES